MRHEDEESPGAAALDMLAGAGRAGGRVVPAGAGMRRVGTPDPDAVTWAATKFQAVRRWAAADFTVEADAGMSVSALNAELAARGQWLPMGTPDGAADTLGGLVSTGIGGVWSAGYGSIRDRILAMTVATPAFGVVRLGAPVVKNVAGYNLWRLYWATRGAFGIVLTVTWKLAPLPRAVATLDSSGPGADIAQALAEAGRWRETANSWAALLLEVGGQEWHLSAVVHGGVPAVDRVRRELGAGVEPRHDIGIREAFGDRLAWQARLPAGGMGPFLEFLAGARHPALAELQSGMVWGFEGNGGGTVADGVEALVERQGGAFRRLAGPWRATEPPAAEAAMWRRLKAAVDPGGVLPALSGADSGTEA